jgi:hypothetical protein
MALDPSLNEDNIVITSNNILVSLNETQRSTLKGCLKKGTLSIKFESIPLDRLPSFSGQGVEID